MKKPVKNVLRTYLVKHPTELRLLDTTRYSYEEARKASVKLGGIVTNTSFAARHGLI